MQTPSEPITIYERGHILRYQKSSAVKPQTPILLLHGWTGNEESMSIFTRNLIKEHDLLSPRGFVIAQPNGYGWVQRTTGGEPDFEAYCSVAETLLGLLTTWQMQLNIPLEHFSIAGFSQGAALGLALACIVPQRVNRLAFLAGFLPPQASVSLPLNHLRVYLAHGTQDQIVPISRAVEAAAWLKQNGAHVTFCQADVGHKLSLGCFNEFDTFLSV